MDFGSSGVYVRQEQVTRDLANLLVETRLRNAGKNKTTFTLQCSLLDAQGRVVAETAAEKPLEAQSETAVMLPLEIKTPHLWHGRRDPYLYTLKVTVRQGNNILEQVAENIGVRFFSIDPDQGFFLNGEPYRLYGVNRHQDRENIKQQLTELIKQNYNHPAICFWSLQNELVPDSDRALYGTMVEELYMLAKGLDSTRPTTVASRSKYDPGEKMNSVSDLLAYNVYRGWYEGKPDDFATFIDTLHTQFPERKLAISEYGAGAGIHQHEWPVKKPAPREPWHPEE